MVKITGTTTSKTRTRQGKWRFGMVWSKNYNLWSLRYVSHLKMKTKDGLVEIKFSVKVSVANAALVVEAQKEFLPLAVQPVHRLK
jgi:hypothetical protein